MWYDTDHIMQQIWPLWRAYGGIRTHDGEPYSSTSFLCSSWQPTSSLFLARRTLRTLSLIAADLSLTENATTPPTGSVFSCSSISGSVTWLRSTGLRIHQWWLRQDGSPVEEVERVWITLKPHTLSPLVEQMSAKCRTDCRTNVHCPFRTNARLPQNCFLLYLKGEYSSM